MLNIYSLSFNTDGWKNTEDSQEQIIWHVSPDETVFVEFKKPTDFKRDVLDPNVRLEFEEFVLQSGGAVVDFQVTKINGLEAIKQVYKYWHPNPQDMRKVYLGVIAFPFAEFCYIVKAQCVETGTTGVREATISLLSPKSKTEQPSNEPIVVKSMEEMFSHMKKTSLTRSISDDEQYDAQFPEHPLTRVRWYINHLSNTLVVSPDLQNAKPYRIY